MAEKIRFQHTIKFIDLDGAIVVLPDNRDIELLEAQLQNAEEALRETRAALASLDRTAGEKPDKEQEAAIVAQRQEAATAEAVKAGWEQALVETRKLVEQVAEDAQQWAFELHRFSYVERSGAQEESRRFDEGIARIDESEFCLAILSRCIDKWPFEGPVTKESVGDLSPQIVDSLHRRLMIESAPSVARLSFRRTGSAGSVERARGGSEPDHAVGGGVAMESGEPAPV